MLSQPHLRGGRHDGFRGIIRISPVLSQSENGKRTTENALKQVSSQRDRGSYMPTLCRIQHGQFFVDALSFSEGSLSSLMDISDDTDT